MSLHFDIRLAGCRPFWRLRSRIGSWMLGTMRDVRPTRDSVRRSTPMHVWCLLPLVSGGRELQWDSRVGDLQRFRQLHRLRQYHPGRIDGRWRDPQACNPDTVWVGPAELGRTGPPSSEGVNRVAFFESRRHRRRRSSVFTQPLERPGKRAKG